MRFDRGYLSPYFITNPEKMEVALDEPLIMLYERKISSVQGSLPLLEQVVKLGRSLLIVAEDVEGEALATLVVNRLAGTWRGRRQGARLWRSPKGDDAGHGDPDRRALRG